MSSYRYIIITKRNNICFIILILIILLKMVAVKKNKSRSNTKLYTTGADIYNNTYNLDKLKYTDMLIVDEPGAKYTITNTFDESNNYIGTGFNVTNIDNLHRSYYFGYVIYEVDIPKNAKKVKHYTSNNKDYKIRTNKIIIKKKYFSLTYKNVKELNFKVDTMFIKKYIEYNKDAYETWTKDDHSCDRKKENKDSEYGCDTDKDIIKMLTRYNDVITGELFMDLFFVKANKSICYLILDHDILLKSEAVNALSICNSRMLDNDIRLKSEASNALSICDSRGGFSKELQDKLVEYLKK